MDAILEPTNRTQTRDAYLASVWLIQRAQRRLMEMVDDEMRRLQHNVTASQALLLYNMKDQELHAGELLSRNCYFGENVSYNLKKLVAEGLLNHRRDKQDARKVLVGATAAGKEIQNAIARLLESQAEKIKAVADLSADDLAAVVKGLTRLERLFVDTVRYRL